MGPLSKVLIGLVAAPSACAASTFLARKLASAPRRRGATRSTASGRRPMSYFKDGQEVPNAMASLVCDWARSRI